MDESQHARLLLAILRERWGEAEQLSGSAPPDAERFTTLCRECDVHGWVRRLLIQRGAGDPFATRTVDALAEDSRRMRRDNMVMIAEAERALDVLLEAGIVPVALKGLDLLHRVYDRIDDRTCDDIDLLVAGEQFPAALEALCRGGWRAPPEHKRRQYLRSSHHLPLRGPGPIAVDLELHWNLAQDERFAIDVPALIGRSLPLDVGGRRVLRLADDDLIAHLLLHQFTHYFDRCLKWAVDLRRISLAAEPDWSRVVRRVRSWGAAAACAAAVVHLRKLFPDWIPASVQQQLPLAGWRRALGWPLRSTHPLEIYRATRLRPVQLYLASVLMEHPAALPGWVLHRARRNRATPEGLDN